ncbi:hypothetical protein B566_EDAN007158 [Ephemera danica]|nr:hypothetical protein B566_EDAN007158 [Ephemera danica]
MAATRRGRDTPVLKVICARCAHGAHSWCSACERRPAAVQSGTVQGSTFAEMQLRLQRRRQQRQQIQTECEAILARNLEVDQLKTEIDMCKERIDLLKQMRKECLANSSRQDEMAKELRKINTQRAERLPRYQERVSKLEKISRVSKESLVLQQNKLKNTQEQLRQVVRTRASQLLRYIFPIHETVPASRSEEEDSMLDAVTSAIAEASHMAFVRGRWVFSDCSGELHHCIVAPMLPASGDYSAYGIWVAANKDSVPGTGGAEGVEHNPAYTISAALTYTSQLVNVLSYYLDVRLPRKQCYSDFCRLEMTDQQFARRVARLNSNILHLCFTQNVPIKLLHPTRTLQNLMLLFNTGVSDLGRPGPVEVEPSLAKSLEDQLTKDLEAFEGNEDDSCSDGEGEDTLPGEWEAVPSLPYQETGAGALVGRSTMDSGVRGLVSTAQGSVASTSVAGGLVNSAVASVASFWRGWTGNK